MITQHIKYLSIPYKHKGRSFEEGVDCIGLVFLFYQMELGIRLPEFLDYALDWHQRGEDHLLTKQGEYGFTEVSRPVYGDVVLLLVKDKVRHCGIVLGPDYFLHMITEGPMVSPLNTGKWAGRVHHYARYKDVK